MPEVIRRTEAYQVFWDWYHQGLWLHPLAFEKLRHGYLRSTAAHFALVIGREGGVDTFDDGDKLSEAETAIVKKLMGPHGYSYYRALLIERGMNGKC